MANHPAGTSPQQESGPDGTTGVTSADNKQSQDDSSEPVKLWAKKVWKPFVAIGVGVAVFATEFALLLSDGISIGDEPLESVPLGDAVSGVARLLGSDELVTLLAWAVGAAIAYASAVVVRRILDDEWVTKLSTSGGEFGGVNRDQSDQIKELAEDLKTIAQEVKERTQQLDDAIDGQEALARGHAVLVDSHVSLSEAFEAIARRVAALEPRRDGQS